MSPGPEFEHVEQPFLDQLVRMGWKHTTGSLDFASATGAEASGSGAGARCFSVELALQQLL